MKTIDRINYLNVALIFLSCILAYITPYYLLVFSYAALGPAHYLTQISWLHDRKYFTSEKYTPLFLALITMAIMLPLGLSNGFLMMTGIFVALILIFPLTRLQQFLALAAAVFWALLLSLYGPIAIFVGLLLPTVIHVFIFTLGFMWAGALKDNSASGYMAIIALLVCATSFFVLPADWYIFGAMAHHPGIWFFHDVANYLARILGTGHDEHGMTRVFGFLSFVYTYHYLNWFSKTRIIAWHEIPRQRAYAIGLVYAAALWFYFYDYEKGFYLLLFLSLLHVVLEFPLNWRTFGMIGSRLLSPASAPAKSL